MQQKSSRPYGKLLITCQVLALLGSANGAGTGASAAGNAGICIDNVLAIALRDSGNGALFDASAASDALISDDICHDLYTSKFFCNYYTPTCAKNQHQIFDMSIDVC